MATALAKASLVKLPARSTVFRKLRPLSGLLVALERPVAGRLARTLAWERALAGAEPAELDRTPTDFISSDSQITYKEVRDQTTGHRLSDLSELGSPAAIKKQAEHLRLLNRIRIPEEHLDTLRALADDGRVGP